MARPVLRRGRRSRAHQRQARGLEQRQASTRVIDRRARRGRRLAHPGRDQPGARRAVTPLEEAARLLRKYRHGAHAVAMASLAAREEARVEGERFWADLGAPDVFGGDDSIAGVTLGGDDAPQTAELALDRAAFQRALYRVAQELRLRQFETE